MHKFDIKNSVSKISKQEIVIQLQNIVSCIKFFTSYFIFQYNQTYKPYYIYNQNEDQFYNEIYTRKW